jgi:hypothetical protein
MVVIEKLCCIFDRASLMKRNVVEDLIFDNRVKSTFIVKVYS